MKEKMSVLKEKLFTKHPKTHSEKYYKRINFLNKYSLVFHALISMVLVFAVELISRRDLMSAFSFVGTHTLAYLYNSFLVFTSLTLVYLFRRRAFSRVIISGVWLILGIINGCVLSNRVTPFGYTDLKCIPELFAMNKTSYFTAGQATVMAIGIISFVLFCVIFFVKGPKFQGKRHIIVIPATIAALLFIVVPVLTSAAQSTNVVASYFSNIAQGYEKYGFVYSFSSSVVDRGMSEPDTYSEEEIDKITDEVNSESAETTTDGSQGPNIICVLLESFVDPDEINTFDVNKDPIPTFHYLEENYSSGYCIVPVVGAGTANTEFEVLTGMSMQFFGTGEYPYKTILKKTDTESIASSLSSIGYSTHVVHNNGGNFYSRANAFSVMGFDSFTSKELMNITEYTPLGSWASDDILVKETIKALDSTPDQADFTYTITVSTHGDYPKYQVIENPEFTVSGDLDEEKAYQWTYYVNQLNAADRFISGLIDELEKRDEDTIVVMFGDHLPTMGLEDEDTKAGDIYKTKYITWNNMGLEKEDADLYAYQLLAKTTDQVGIHEGNVLKYHQTQGEDAGAVDEEYVAGLENLQYDILYGNRYCEPEGAVFKTDMVMGIDNVVVSSVMESVLSDNTMVIYGSGFTKWSWVYINGEKVNTKYISGSSISISGDSIKDGDTVVVNQLGSGSTIFRSSNEYTFVDTRVPEDATEVAEPSEAVEALDTLDPMDVLDSVVK